MTSDRALAVRGCSRRTNTMINNDRIHRCACRVRDLQHVFSTDASSKHVLLVDPQNVHLLRDASWSVSPMHGRSRLLRARATTSAPGIRVGQSLHHLVTRLRKAKKRRVHAVNGSYLDARRAN